MNIRFLALPVLALLILLPSLPAQARPEMAAKMKEQQAAANSGSVKSGSMQGGPNLTQRASERFDEMDADKDGKVTWAEFSACYPNMREAAFAMIDTSADGFIDRVEWIDFSAGHAGGGMGKSMPVMPPSGQNTGQNTGQNAGQGAEQGTPSAKPAPGTVQGTAEGGSASSASSGGPADETPPQTDKSGNLLLPGIKGGK